MLICPWCGTNYLVFQTNCSNCGGPLRTTQTTTAVKDRVFPDPPAPPRPISTKYAWHLLAANGGWIPALLLGFIGIILSLVGTGLTFGIITVSIRIPFLFLGLLLLAIGGCVLYRRYHLAMEEVLILKIGDATHGRVTRLRANHIVTVKGRHPWVIRYTYNVHGATYSGKTCTMNPPALQLHEGGTVRVLYLGIEPQHSSIYPHP
jgi:hypothetical protein